MEKIAEILKEIFPSEEMASYLARCPFDKTVSWNRQHFVFDDAPPEELPLSRDDLADASAGAPISLERKRKLFLRLAEDENDGLFRKWADLVSQAIQEMQPKPGEVFYLIAHNYCEESSHLGDNAVGAFLSWEYIYEAIREYWGDPIDEDDLICFTVEKWTPDGNGRMKNNYSYEVIGDEIWFCDCEDFPFHEQLALNGCGAVDLNLQVPFRAGDILTVDCRPYAPVSHIAVLGIADNCDCCCFQALYREGDRTWDIGAVKHSHVFPTSISRRVDYSPLYRLATFHGELPEEERLLEQVSLYINGEEARGAALWEHIFQLGKGNRDVTEDQILAYINEKGSAKNEHENDTL